MSFNIEKLMQVAKPVSEKVKAEAEFRKENKEWLRKSAKIALAIRRELRLQGMSQQDLAKRMALSPQYVGRILKGQENLTLETVSKIEDAIGMQLIKVGREEQQPFSSQQPYVLFVTNIDVSEAWDLSSPSYCGRREKQVLIES